MVTIRFGSAVVKSLPHHSFPAGTTRTMLTSLLRRFRPVWKPLSFSNEEDIPRVAPHQKIEEETIPDYLAGRYYPVRVGEIIHDRYQIVGKLGYGTTSTVWLARDLRWPAPPQNSSPARLSNSSSCSDRRHVALKLFILTASMGQQLEDELNIYRRMAEAASCGHPGRIAVRPLLDCFDVKGPDGLHGCLIHPPLWDSVLALLHRNPVRRLPAEVLAVILKYLFQALDFLHTECHVAHAGTY